MTGIGEDPLWAITLCQSIFNSTSINSIGLNSSFIKEGNSIEPTVTKTCIGMHIHQSSEASIKMALQTKMPE